MIQYLKKEEVIVKAKEVIERLQKLDQEKEVVFLGSGENPIDDGFGIKDIFEIKGSNDNDYIFLVEI